MRCLLSAAIWMGFSVEPTEPYNDKHDLYARFNDVSVSPVQPSKCRSNGEGSPGMTPSTLQRCLAIPVVQSHRAPSMDLYAGGCTVMVRQAPTGEWWKKLFCAGYYNTGERWMLPLLALTSRSCLTLALGVEGRFRNGVVRRYPVHLFLIMS